MPRRVVCTECGGVCHSKQEPYVCKKCKKLPKEELIERRSESYRKWKYGLENGEFDALWVVFKGCCAICDKPLKPPIRGRGQPLDVVAIDHDHVTGNIRGLLCNACNKGLGLFFDDPEILTKAARYLNNGKKTSDDSQNQGSTTNS